MRLDLHDLQQTESWRTVPSRGKSEGQPNLVWPRSPQDETRADTISGTLDISSLSLLRIPAEVYTDLLGLDPASLSHPPTPPAPRLNADLQGMTRSFEPHMAIAEDAGNRFGGKSRVKEEWVEPEELVGLRAVENEIKELDIEIGAFGGLKSIDVC